MSSLPSSQNITRVTLANGVTILVYEKFDANLSNRKTLKSFSTKSASKVSTCNCLRDAQHCLPGHY